MIIRRLKDSPGFHTGDLYSLDWAHTYKNEFGLYYVFLDRDTQKSISKKNAMSGTTDSVGAFLSDFEILDFNEVWDAL